MSWTKNQIELVFLNHFHRSPEWIEKTSYGLMNFTYDIGINGMAFILKIYPASRFIIAGKQFQLLKSIEAEPVKVPKVIFHGTLDKTSYLIYEKIPGETLSFEQLRPEDKRVISQQIAHNIKDLSTINFNWAGSLTEDEHSFSDWGSFLDHQMRDGFKYLRSFGNVYVSDFEYIEAAMWEISGELSQVATGLVWSDFCQENIIIYDNRLSGFVDFEGCFAGDPILSLGYLFAREGESEFYRAMEKEFMLIFTVQKPHIYFYAILRLLRISKYLSEPLPNGQVRGSVWDFFKGLKAALGLITI